MSCCFILSSIAAVCSNSPFRNVVRPLLRRVFRIELSMVSRPPSQRVHETLLNESESSAEPRGGSLRSSDGACSYSGCDDSSDEKVRVLRKMDEIRERLTRISLASEVDVENFLSVTGDRSGGQQNPQIARVQQHFEKKNKKNTQEKERLKKKLEQLQARLDELDKGIVAEPSPRSQVLSNIRKTGPLLREMTGSVISAPRDLAHMIKNTFGSVDNLPDSLKEDASNVGHSTFYPNAVTGDDRLRCYSSNECTEQQIAGASSLRHGIETVPAIPVDFTIQSTGSEGNSTGAPTHSTGVSELREDVRELKQQNQLLCNQMSKIQTYMQTELSYYNGALHEERIKLQRLEESLNETIEVHQAEMSALRLDLTTIGNRMDYHYNDRFRSIEEMIESTQNRVCRTEMIEQQMIRMETNVREWVETRPRSMFNSMMLMGANALVEILKLVLFVVSFALDFVKPFTGTRTRSGCLILISIIAVFVAQSINWISFFRLFLALFRANHPETPAPYPSSSVDGVNEGVPSEGPSPVAS